MKFGLSERHLSIIRSVVSEFPSIASCIIYGSRAKGNYKTGSDIDLALKGRVSYDVVSKVHYVLNEETVLPYFVDVLSYDLLDSVELKDHIDRVGKRV